MSVFQAAFPGFPLRKLARRFWRRDDGSLLIFGLFCFVTMLLVAGVAIDLMRHELRRTYLQNTIDRAVLMAASLKQQIDPKDVVREVFRASGLEPPADRDIHVVVSGTERVVSVDIRDSVPTLFMRMVGFDQLPLPAAGKAVEKVGLMEVSLVLDVSGSMADLARSSSTTKIALLRQAAEQFVSTLFVSAEGSSTGARGKLSISVVPYNQQVTPGKALAAQFNLAADHDKTSCVDLETATFATTALSTTAPLARTAYADLRYANKAPTPLKKPYFECYELPSNEVVAFSDNQVKIVERIRSLAADGDTAIDIGAKWGVALLNPSTRSALDGLISAGDPRVSASIGGRPLDYGISDAMKILVLMTDGQNTNTYALQPAYKTGPSDVVKDNATGYLYYFDAASKTYTKLDANAPKSPQFTAGKTVLTWQQVWQTYSVRWFADNAYRVATGKSDFLSKAVIHTSSTGKDSQLRSVCDAARAKGIMVFTIAFNAEVSGEVALKSCASSPAYYFDVENVDLSTAFVSIARTITKLRLTH